jgi:hypothetical protein
LNENGGGFGRRHHSGKAIQMSNDNVEAVLSKQSMLEMANATRAILDGSTSQIEKIIREHDLGSTFAAPSCAATSRRRRSAMLPYLIMLVAGLLIVAFVPWFTLFLPHYFGFRG